MRITETQLRMIVRQELVKVLTNNNQLDEGFMDTLRQQAGKLGRAAVLGTSLAGMGMGAAASQGDVPVQNPVSGEMTTTGDIRQTARAKKITNVDILIAQFSPGQKLSAGNIKDVFYLSDYSTGNSVTVREIGKEQNFATIDKEKLNKEIALLQQDRKRHNHYDLKQALESHGKTAAQYQEVLKIKRFADNMTDEHKQLGRQLSSTADLEGLGVLSGFLGLLLLLIYIGDTKWYEKFAYGRDSERRR